MIVAKQPMCVGHLTRQLVWCQIETPLFLQWLALEATTGGWHWRVPLEGTTGPFCPKPSSMPFVFSVVEFQSCLTILTLSCLGFSFVIWKLCASRLWHPAKLGLGQACRLLAQFSFCISSTVSIAKSNPYCALHHQVVGEGVALKRGAKTTHRTNVLDQSSMFTNRSTRSYWNTSVAKEETTLLAGHGRSKQ
jgi:hypothetical protein